MEVEGKRGGGNKRWERHRGWKEGCLLRGRAGNGGAAMGKAMQWVRSAGATDHCVDPVCVSGRPCCRGRDFASEAKAKND